MYTAFKQPRDSNCNILWLVLFLNLHRLIFNYIVFIMTLNRGEIFQIGAKEIALLKLHFLFWARY